MLQHPQATPTIDKARGLIFLSPMTAICARLNLADGAEYDDADRIRLALRPRLEPEPDRQCGLHHIGPRLRRSGQPGRLPMYAAAMSGLVRRGSGPLRDASAVSAMDVKDLQKSPRHLLLHQRRASRRPLGPRRAWRASPRGTVILETSNGRHDPLRGDFSETILKLAPKAVRVVDAFLPSNHAHNLKMDLSGSASPVVFEFGGKTLIAATQKEGYLRLLDANNLGGDDHHDAACGNRRAWAMTRKPAPIRAAACGARSPPTNRMAAASSICPCMAATPSRRPPSQ